VVRVVAAARYDGTHGTFYDSIEVCDKNLIRPRLAQLGPRRYYILIPENP